MENKYLLGLFIFFILFAVVMQQRNYTGRVFEPIDDNKVQSIQSLTDEVVVEQRPISSMQPQSAPQPRTQEMHAAPRRVPVSINVYGDLLSRTSSPRTLARNSQEYFISILNRFPPRIVVYGLGPNGHLDWDDTGIHSVQEGNQIAAPNGEPAPAFGDTILYSLFNFPAPQFTAILAKDTGTDGFFGTGNEGIYTVAVPYAGFTIRNYQVLYDLAPNGALYLVNSGQTNYLIRHNPVDGIFQAFGLPTPTNDILEVTRQGINPLTWPVRPATSISRLVTWVDNQQNSRVTNLLGPGPDNQFGGIDEYYTLNGGGTNEEIGLINYDGSAVLTSLRYTGIPQVALYDLRPVGINGPQGIDGPRGRIPVSPQAQNIPLPTPQGTVTGLIIIDLDIDGGFIDQMGRRIDSAATIAYKVNVTDGKTTREIMIILYINPGQNNRWLDGDDKVVVYQDLTSRFNVIDIYVKEEFVTFIGMVNGVNGLYHWAV